MSGKALACVAVLMTLVVSLLYVRARFLVVELSYEVSRAQKTKAILEQQKRALRVELATLRAPRRIEKFARKILGLKSSSSLTISSLRITLSLVFLLPLIIIFSI